MEEEKNPTPLVFLDKQGSKHLVLKLQQIFP